MHCLHIRIAGPMAMRVADRVESAIREAGLAACFRPQPNELAFDVIAADEQIHPLLHKLWALEPMGSADLHMTCQTVPIRAGIDPGSGPATGLAGLVTCQECRDRRLHEAP